MDLNSREWILFDCANGKHCLIDNNPFVIGSGEGCDFRIEGAGAFPEHCKIERDGKVLFISARKGDGAPIFDGLPLVETELTPNEDHTLIVGQRLLLLRGGSRIRQWLEGLNTEKWYIFDKKTYTKYGHCAFEDLSTQLALLVPDTSGALLLCQGMTTMGFYADHVLPFLPPPRVDPKVIAAARNASAPAPEAPPPTEASTVNSEYGEFTCPVCWLKFDRGDAMNVAVHASLRGDPILGEAHMQRFFATRFNDRGQAIDAMGIPSPDQACPHCRRKLHPGFLDSPHHIFSIVGAPSSGKSYYLSVLIKTLQTTLFQQFGVVFRDADPSDNVILNQMKTQLFSASTPEDAVLAKTELEGAMYETLPRLGRKVRLPKPFSFNLSNPKDPSQDFSVVFYDNAGEHFEPTRNSSDSPGAQHIAAASGIFFLFDPLHNAEFRRQLTGLKDPQIQSRRMDQQDVILTETEVRIKSLLGLDSKQRIATPFAVIVGKSDTWSHLLGDAEIRWPVADGHLDLAIVRANSKRLRALLLDLCPAIVANSETISSDVMYFAASPLGSSPIEFTDARGVKMIGPDPQKLHPRDVEIATLWVLSKIAPGMVPVKEEGA